MGGTHRQLNRLLVVQTDVCSHRPSRVHLTGSRGRAVYAVIEVRIEETNRNRHRYVLMQLTEITEVERPLVRTYVLQFGSVQGRQRNVTHREIREAGTDTTTQVTEVIETCEISQVDVADQLTQPRRVVSGDTALGVHVSVLGRVPILRVEIRFRRYTYITQAGCTSIRSDRQGRHCRDNRIWRGFCLRAHRSRKKQSHQRNTDFFHLCYVFCFFSYFVNSIDR